MAYCTKCGSEVAEDAAFCSKCGSNLNGESLTRANQNPTPPLEPEILNDDVKRVNQIAYVLFAIILGSLGIHKFYAGKIVMGVIYLCLCWTFIPGLLGLIEGILAITKKADRDGNIVV